MDQEFERLCEKISTATSHIAKEYFELPVTDSPHMYRERVYCYELYHQLRCVWEDLPFSLGGEIDKSGNPFFNNGPFAHAKPDLLLHSPGDMGGNLAVVEVKPAGARLDRIKKDLSKLHWFHKKAHYHKGVLLVYGDDGEPEALAKRIRNAACTDDFSFLELFYHRRVGEAAERIPLQPKTKMNQLTLF